jgi:hypothetical protein
MAEWNPRFVAYAKAHGQTPEGMLQNDKEKFPGGCMAGFMLWINTMRQKFFQQHPEHCFVRVSGKSFEAIANQEAWTEFLNNSANSCEVENDNIDN